MPSDLQPVFDTLMAGPRPQTTLYWLNRSTGPAILRAMALGQVEITHAAFESMPSNKTVNYLRDLLVAVGVLPPFHAELERVTPWLNDILAAMPKEQGDVLERFARWHVLRRLRHQEQAGAATHGAINAARASIVATARFLAWLAAHNTSITAVTQTQLDQYAVEHSGQAKAPGLDRKNRTDLRHQTAHPPTAAARSHTGRRGSLGPGRAALT